MRRIAVLSLSILMLTGAVATASPDEDRVVMVSASDPEMNAAIARARASLGTFWKQYETPDAGVNNLGLKVGIADGDDVEYFWLVDIERNGQNLSGIINNDPEIVKNVKLGQRYAFTEGEIADWEFVREGKVAGNETARVLIKRLSPEEARQYDGMFETP